MVLDLLRELAAEVREMQMTLPERIERTIRGALVHGRDAVGIVRVMYRLRDDADGEPAVFFKILISDEAGLRENLRDTVQRVEEVGLREACWPLTAYMSFRTVSEQAKLQDPEWEAQ
jgi:hypothetical protein